jgi:hypothetical protein
MGVDYTAYLRKGLVKSKVSGGVRRWFEVTVNDIAVKVKHNHIVLCHSVITDSAGLDDHQPAVAVYPGSIAPGINHKALAYQLQVRLENLFL